MEFNSLKGATAYANAPNFTPGVDQTLRNQNRQAAETDPDAESTRAVQEAFKVTLTSEAQDLLAAEAAEKTTAQEAVPSENETGQPAGQAYEVKQIVNIVS